MDIKHLDYIKKEKRPDLDFSKLVKLETITQGSYAINEIYSRNLSIHVDSEIMITDKFVDFCKSKKIEIRCIESFGTLVLKVDNEDKLVSQGVFNISNKDFSFVYICLFKESSNQNEMLSFICLDKDSDLEKYLSLKNEFVLFKNKNKVNVVGVGKLEIKNSQPIESLFLNKESKQIKEELDNFFKEKNSVKCMMFAGEAGSGKSTYIKGIVKDYNLYTVAVTNNLTPDSLFESFKQVEDNGPSILVLEYIDEWLGSVIDFSLFFQLIDNLNPKHNILVLATVDSKENMPEVMFIGPNRFETCFEFKKPNKEIVKRFLDSKSIFSEKLISSLSKKSEENDLEWCHINQFVSNCIKSKGTGDLSDSRVNTLFNAVVKEKELFEKRINFDKYFV